MAGNNKTTEKTKPVIKKPVAKRKPATKKTANNKSAQKKTADKKPSYLTITAYAKHRKENKLQGGTHQAVRKAIDSARLLNCIVKHNGKEMITSAKDADKEWASKTTPDNQASTLPPAETEDQKERREQQDKTSFKYQDARARRLDAQAEKAEIELQQAKGNVLDLSIAAKNATTIGAELQQSYKNITRAEAADLAADTNPHSVRIKLQKLLEKVTNDTIKKLRKFIPHE